MYSVSLFTIECEHSLKDTIITKINIAALNIIATPVNIFLILLFVPFHILLTTGAIPWVILPKIVTKPLIITGSNAHAATAIIIMTIQFIAQKTDSISCLKILPGSTSQIFRNYCTWLLLHIQMNEFYYHSCNSHPSVRILHCQNCIFLQ